MHDQKRIAKVQKYVDRAVAIMHVPGDVNVDADYCADDAAAEISRSGFGATINLSRGFFKMSPANQRTVLCHELCHVYFYAVDDVLIPLLGPVLGEVDKHRLEESVGNAEHRVIIESLQRVCARLLPLPKF